jgi:O-antigen/teichoic acid export membrane protein
VQVLTPVLFAFRGPVEAGRMGLSMSIAGYLWSIVIAWMYTKATPFGKLVARGEFEELDRLFFRTLKPSLSLLAGIVVVCMAGLIGVQHAYPKLAARMVSPQIFVLLLLTAMSTFVVQSMAIYLRAHKSEPFLWQSITVAGLTCGGSLLLAPHWGTTGAAVTYFSCTGVVGVLTATVIFQTKRRARTRTFECQNS